MARSNIGGILLSLFKSSLILTLCICINIFGILTSQITKSILFVDVCGTAISSLVYGPIHGALVGMTSNYLGQFFVAPVLGGLYSINLDHYFMFGPVHMLVALVWSVVPRLLKGRLATDLFCDDPDLYPCGKIFLGIVFLAFLSNIAGSATAAIITKAYGLGCSPPEPSLSDNVTCNLQTLIGSSSVDLSNQFMKLVIARAAIGLPDHIISLSAAILIVSYILKGRRYKMSGIFGQTIITNRPAVASIYFFILINMIALYIIFSLDRFGSDATTSSILICCFFVVSVQALIITKKFDLLVFIKDGDHKAHIYPDSNTELKEAFSDCMHFSVLISVCIYYWLEWLRSPRLDTAVQFFQEKLFGALGVVFLITFLEYLTLILARVLRYVRQYSEDDKNYDVLKSHPHVS